MKDYASMSDREIAEKIGKAIGLGNIGGCLYIKNGVWTRFDPCNNPEDAWLIINASRISIMFDGTDPQYEGEHHEWCDAISSCQKFGIQHQSNPLRAAMIVFLMMKEGEL